MRRILLVSDGTGETASQMLKAAMVQFNQQDVWVTRYKNVRHVSQIDAIIQDAVKNQALVMHTLVSAELRAALHTQIASNRLKSVDILGPMLLGLCEFFGAQPKSIAGLLHNVDESYFRRIEAMEYTLQHDDGRDLTGLDKADVVILGVSRTSKTPLSIYLSHQGWKVCNIPLIRGFEIPAEVFAIDQRRVVCLTIDSEELTKIRRARLERLGHDKGGDYADLERVVEEIEFARDLYRKNRKWPLINVTGKAVEETASEIIRVMAGRRLLPTHLFEGAPTEIAVGDGPEQS